MIITIIRHWKYQIKLTSHQNVIKHLRSQIRICPSIRRVNICEASVWLLDWWWWYLLRFSSIKLSPGLRLRLVSGVVWCGVYLKSKQVWHGLMITFNCLNFLTVNVKLGAAWNWIISEASRGENTTVRRGEIFHQSTEAHKCVPLSQQWVWLR